MKALWAYVKANWKTNLIGAIVFIYSIPQCVAAIQAWQHNQIVDWKGVFIAIIGAGFLAAKDGDNHSTQLQVMQSTHEKEKENQ